jgi:hypothetical protein
MQNAKADQEVEEKQRPARELLFKSLGFFN